MIGGVTGAIAFGPIGALVGAGIGAGCGAVAGAGTGKVLQLNTDKTMHKARLNEAWQPDKVRRDTAAVLLAPPILSPSSPIIMITLHSRSATARHATASSLPRSASTTAAIAASSSVRRYRSANPTTPREHDTHPPNHPSSVVSFAVCAVYQEEDQSSRRRVRGPSDRVRQVLQRDRLRHGRRRPRRCAAGHGHVAALAGQTAASAAHLELILAIAQPLLEPADDTDVRWRLATTAVTATSADGAQTCLLVVRRQLPLARSLSPLPLPPHICA